MSLPFEMKEMTRVATTCKQTSRSGGSPTLGERYKLLGLLGDSIVTYVGRTRQWPVHTVIHTANTLKHKREFVDQLGFIRSACSVRVTGTRGPRIPNASHGKELP
ncbi:MAG TPA: hypothetical protein V6C97_10765, partial [Oculatellaceae cyanobacterium]